MKIEKLRKINPEEHCDDVPSIVGLIILMFGLVIIILAISLTENPVWFVLLPFPTILLIYLIDRGIKANAVKNYFKKACKNCNFIDESNQFNYCPNCGGRFIWKPTYKYCKNCREVYNQAFNHCPLCGSKLIEEVIVND